jgi:small-conductance mechanosensitive channel
MTRPLRRLFALLAGTALACVAPIPPDASAADTTGASTATARRPVAADSTVVHPPLPDSAVALVERSRHAPPETLAFAPAASVPVLLGGREVYRVRVGRGGLDPAGRAAAIRARLDRAVSDRRLAADSVRLIPDAAGIQVRLGSEFLWLIMPGDLAGRDSQSVVAELERLPAAIREGIERERAARRPARLLVSAAIAFGLTLLALGLARLLLMGSRRWRQWLTLKVAKHLPAIRLGAFEVLSKAQVGALVTGILARVDVVVGLVLTYGYLATLFSLFPWTQGWSALLLTFAWGQTLTILRGLMSGLPGVFAIVVVFLVFRWLAALAGRFFDAIAGGTLVLGGFHPELALPSKRLVRILLWVIAVMVAYPYIPGSGTKAVQGVSILFGVMLSLGSTGFVGNMIAGILLTYSRSFRTGDRVRIADQEGDVVSLGFFATKLRSIRNEEVTIPNGQVANAPIVNYTRLAEDPGLVLHTEVTIGYDVEWRKVHALLIEAALRVDGVQQHPPPQVFQRSLNDSHVSYELTCTTHQSHPQLRLYSDLHAEIQDAFSRAGVEILSPSYHAVRDANAAVLPEAPAGPRPEPGGFRVRGSSPGGGSR